MKVIKRDGKKVDFDPNKIVVAISKANREVIGNEKASIQNINYIVEAIEKLELKDDLSWKISFDISVIKEEILKELKEIEKEYGEVILDELEDLRAKKILLLVNLMELEELKFNLNPFKYIPIYKNLNYFMILINKDNGKIYKLDGIYDFDLEFIEIAENFDEFIERLYLGDPIDFEDNFEDNNNYEEILRKIEESTGKKE